MTSICLMLFIFLSSFTGRALLVQHIIKGLILPLRKKSIKFGQRIQGKTYLEQSFQ